MGEGGIIFMREGIKDAVRGRRGKFLNIPPTINPVCVWAGPGGGDCNQSTYYLPERITPLYIGYYFF